MRNFLLAQQRRLNDGHAYARAAMADPEMQAYYQEQATKKQTSAYSLAFSNYFKIQRQMGK